MPLAPAIKPLEQINVAAQLDVFFRFALCGVPEQRLDGRRECARDEEPEKAAECPLATRRYPTTQRLVPLVVAMVAVYNGADSDSRKENRAKERGQSMRYTKSVLCLLTVSLLVVALHAQADRAPRKVFGAVLRGASETPLTLSGGSGHLLLTVSDDESSVHYVLEFTGLQTTVFASHIHVGQPNVNGSVTVFFCGGTTTPACPQEGVVEGDFTADDVIGLLAQQLEPNNLAKLLAAIRAGETYVNVHTMASPGGEIRGQIQAVRRGDRQE